MNYIKEYERWLSSDVLTEDERAELLQIKDNEEMKALRFSAPMDFGTLHNVYRRWLYEQIHSCANDSRNCRTR